MTPEKKIQNKIISIIQKLESEDYNIWYDRRQAGGFSYRAGLADLYMVINGEHIEIEVKAENGSQSPLQERWQEKCIRLGTSYILVNNANAFKEILEEYKKQGILYKIKK